MTNSFAFLLDDLVGVCSSFRYHVLEKGSVPPSLDVYFLRPGNGPALCMLFFPDINCEVSSDGRIVIRQMTIRFDPAPTTTSDPEKVYESSSTSNDQDGSSIH